MRRKHAIILSGLSGTGKTRMRTRHPDLKDLPCVDIADVYRDMPGAPWADVMHEFLLRVREALDEHGTVVLEGYFLPGSTSQRMLLDDLRVAGATYEIISLWAPYEVCIGRLERARDSGEISEEEFVKRAEVLARVVARQAHNA